MKVITKTVLDMCTMEVLEETSFEYTGQVALAKGSGGGGGSDWPSYLKKAHNRALTANGDTELAHSITYFINNLFDNSPYMDYLPDKVDDMFGERPTTLYNLFENNLNIDVVATFNAVFASVSTCAAYTDTLNSEIALMNDDMDSTVLPRFQTGMRDMQCVMTSAFSIGQALLESKKNLAVTKLAAELNRAMVNVAGQVFQQYLSWHTQLVAQGLEAARMYIAGKFDETKFYSEANVKDSTWNLELFQHYSAVLASISGVSPINDGGSKSGSKVQNTLGGAASGASAGMAAGPWGALAGGIVGGVAGYFS
jgi:hypothetical protein